MRIRIKPVVTVVKRKVKSSARRKSSSLLGKSLKLAAKTTLNFGKLMTLVLVGRL